MGVKCLVFANKHTFEIDKVKCKGKQSKRWILKTSKILN